MRKIGDTVKIKSKEWIDAQPKDEDGDIAPGQFMASDMFVYAGKDAIITRVWGETYFINIDEQEWTWADWMFEDSPDA